MLPGFIPADAPKEGIVDCSGLLSTAEVQDIQDSFKSLSYNPKVIILPRGFSPSDLRGFSREVAEQWSINGDRLLLVVDVSGRKVRSLSGDGLLRQGVTGDFLSREGIDNNFIPYMKRKDLPGAIKHFATAVDSKVSIPKVDPRMVTTPIVINNPSPAPVININPHVGSYLTITMVGVAIIGTLILRHFKGKENKQLRARYNSRKADLIELFTNISALATPNDATLRADLSVFNSQMSKFLKEDEELAKVKGLWGVSTKLKELLTSVDFLAMQGKSLGMRMVGNESPKPSYTIPKSQPKTQDLPRKVQTQQVVKKTTTPKKESSSSSTWVFFDNSSSGSSSSSSESSSSSSSRGDSGSSSYNSGSSSWGDSGSSSFDSGSSSFGDGGGSW